MKKNIENSFIKIFGEKDICFSSVTPGRANLIGEHVDYQGGWVMPFAINRFIYAIGRKRDDRKIKIFSFNYQESTETSLDSITYQKEKTWANYLLGVIREYHKSDWMSCGVEIAFGGNIPVASGLSSSAALEIATASLLQKIFSIEIPPLKMIKLAQTAENAFVGVNCGIMDQFSVHIARKDHAVMINCKTLNYEYVPLFFKEESLVLVNTRKTRKLSASIYNDRVKSANTALETIKKFEKVECLAELSSSRLQRYKNRLSEVQFKRALHIVEENQRVITAAKLLSEKKTEEFGQLMYLSHKSLKTLYEISCDELDFIVDFSAKFKGIRGARLTGAGMGGCCIVLIKKDCRENFKNSLQHAYKRTFGISPAFYPVKPVNGTFYR